MSRVIIKLSGEALAGGSTFGLDIQRIRTIAQEIIALSHRGMQLGIVVGGGNFFRGEGRNGSSCSRIIGDHIGMMATGMNALALLDAFHQLGVKKSIVLSSFGAEGILERYNFSRARLLLEEGWIVILAGGTGNPLVTTDTALCLRGIELEADMVLKATGVDGIYGQDPKLYPAAKMYTKISYAQVIEQGLKVMDTAAFNLGYEHNLRLGVFNINKEGALTRMVEGLPEGTWVENFS